MAEPVIVGAVLYDPKVSVIWEIIRDFFDAQGAPIDVAFYSTYEDQNDGLLSGAIDIAWNSPLAWVGGVAAADDVGCCAAQAASATSAKTDTRRPNPRRTGSMALEFWPRIWHLPFPETTLRRECPVVFDADQD